MSSVYKKLKRATKLIRMGFINATKSRFEFCNISSINYLLDIGIGEKRRILLWYYSKLFEVEVKRSNQNV